MKPFIYAGKHLPHHNSVEECIKYKDREDTEIKCFTITDDFTIVEAIRRMYVSDYKPCMTVSYTDADGNKFHNARWFTESKEEAEKMLKVVAYLALNETEKITNLLNSIIKS